MLTMAGALHAQTFSFGLWGDMPYAKAGDEPKMPAILHSINKAPLDFSIFVGDIKDGSSKCTDDVYTDAIKLFDGNQAVVTPNAWKGRNSQVQLGRFSPIVVAVPAGSAGRIQTQVARPEPLVAPLMRGQALGALKVTLDQKPLVEVPLLVLETVEQASFIGRAWDSVRLWVK